MFASGQAIYAYVGGNPVSLVDPFGLSGGPAAKGVFYPKGTLPKAPPEMSANDAERGDPSKGQQNPVDLTNGFLCAIAGLTGSSSMATKACTSPDSSICLVARCTPQAGCGKPYTIDYRSRIPSLVDPDAKCTCIEYGINPKGDGTLPGLAP